MPWWESLNQCHGQTKKGLRCKRSVKRAYLVGNEVVIPLTCFAHTDQEKANKLKNFKRDKP